VTKIRQATLWLSGACNLGRMSRT